MFHDAGGVFRGADDPARVRRPGPRPADYGSSLSFSDPDGNTWFLQEVTTRLPGGSTAGQTRTRRAADLADAMRRAAAAHGEHEEADRKGRPGLAGLVRAVHGRRADRSGRPT